jgi:plasmid stabilization system protein ParE
MAERKVIWTLRAEEEFQQVLAFYINRNGNSIYSSKLLKRVEKLLSLLIVFPLLGRITNNNITRVVVKGDFQIFYEADDNFVQVVSFWDTRQNPENRIDQIRL